MEMRQLCQADGVEREAVHKDGLADVQVVCKILCARNVSSNKELIIPSQSAMLEGEGARKIIAERGCSANFVSDSQKPHRLPLL